METISFCLSFFFSFLWETQTLFASICPEKQRKKRTKWKCLKQRKWISLSLAIFANELFSFSFSAPLSSSFCVIVSLTLSPRKCVRALLQKIFPLSSHLRDFWTNANASLCDFHLELCSYSLKRELISVASAIPS